MDFKKYIASLQETIEDKKAFSLKFFIIDHDTQKKIEAAINLIFQKYFEIEMSGIIYTCVKELLINGSKANLKRVLFERDELNIDDDNDYLNGMMEFRNILNESSYHKFLRDLKKSDYWVNLKFEYNENGMRVTVINNAHIAHLEEKRLRDKLKRAMKYEDIAQFYIDQGDEMEGAGMGIALIVMLLKGIGIDPSLFRIGNTPENRTFARIEIPFNENYVPIRRAYNKSHRRNGD
jgi:hypothetical protein